MQNITKDFFEKHFKVVQPSDILVKVVWETELKSDSGIVIDLKPSMVEDRPTRGEAIQIGKEVKNIEVGDIVYWAKTDGIDLYREDGIAFILLNEERIIGKE